MRYVWFWTFWHWSREGFREGALLRGPLHGVAGHWDEWFRHEASGDDLNAIEETGRNQASQREFIAWLYRHWALEGPWRDNRAVPRFVLGQLAQVEPFNRWTTLARHHSRYGVGGISAVVLAEDSPGTPDDVREVEALLLPAEADANAPRVVAEGFVADAAELETARRATGSVVAGRGLGSLLLRWIVGGRRPYPHWLCLALTTAWAAVGGMIVYLMFGPDPGEHLFAFTVALASLWSVLVAVASVTAGRHILGAWRQGRRWATRLNQDHVRLRMAGGLTLQGGSAGLAFSLNTLLALYRADPAGAGRSWVWHSLLAPLRRAVGSWAATGVIAADGSVMSVVLEPKLRACLEHAGITHIVIPRQNDAGPAAIDAIAASRAAAPRDARPPEARTTALRLGFAAEHSTLRSHPCRSLAHAVFTIAGLASGWQSAVGAFALVVSAVVLAAFPDVRTILVPPRAPVVVAPSSPSPYHLWVSLDTEQPSAFRVVLESDFWANRIANVQAFGGVDGSMRAEILLHRRVRQVSFDEEDGRIWIERRRRFLQREFAAGERVGQYTLSYVTRLGTQ